MRQAARQGSLALALLGAWLCLAVPARAADGPGRDVPEPLVVLPLQDRSGDPAMAEAVAAALLERLAEGRRVVGPATARDALRRLRIRDSGSAPPATLGRLAAELGAGAFLSATLHVAAREPTAQIALSARLVVPQSPLLAWAGFVAASGLDGERWLGLGRVDDPEALAQDAVRRLVLDLLNPGAGRAPRVPRARDTYSAGPLSLSELGTIAVVPFDAATDAPGAGEMGTAIALAVLSRRGARLAAPGAVEEIMKGRDALSRGEVDAPTREALRAGAGAAALFTGSVERCVLPSGGQASEPEVFLSARLILADGGRILWTGGLERRSRDHEGLFGRRHTFAAGALAEQTMESLVSSIGTPVPAVPGRSQ